MGWLSNDRPGLSPPAWKWSRYRGGDWPGARLLFPEAAVRFRVIEERADAFAAVPDDVLADVDDGAHALRIKRHAEEGAARGVARPGHEAATGGSKRSRPGIRLKSRSYARMPPPFWRAKAAATQSSQSLWWLA